MKVVLTAHATRRCRTRRINPIAVVEACKRTVPPTGPIPFRWRCGAYACVLQWRDGVLYVITVYPWRW